ncbi:MAG: alpha/beta hydrolase [Cyanobacteria bacterium K_DeepCast_35m_m2_155]|nr:alpha/beta hydrolase [Cyanobacteria bacterium K_DeepCast_35m_m2_155]
MTPQLGGMLETLQVDLAGRQLRLVLERRGPAAAPLGLLLPALSTVSSRGEWQALAEAVGDQRQLVSFDWPGFGDSDRPAISYDAALLRSALRAVLSYLRTTNRQRITVIAAGHSASVALGLAAEWSARWQSLVAVAPTWRGPLPTMTGWPPQQFSWLQQVIAAPLIGPALYRLNTSRAVLKLMLRRHVWLDPDLLTPQRIREQQQLARSPGARFASVAFVTGGLDPAVDRAWWLQQARLLQCPLQLVVAAQAPPRSRSEMEALAAAADQVSVVPGRLGLHQEFGALLARQLLENVASID